MKKFCSILFITILLFLTMLGISRQPIYATSTNNAIQILLEVKEKLYQIKVTILDENGNPIAGAKVTLYPDTITKYTDMNGMVVFDNVIPGEHRIVVEHKGQIGEQRVVLSGQTETFDFHITLEQTRSPSLGLIVVIGILTIVIGILTILLMKGRRRI